ncbi:hypothetical protein CON65_25480 [Bacillus pseudomycoides]|uniref:Uncharacterized protein n=1 Tax=Bacillus pseudomycoides TaxID=64104 RepID=A0AA91V7C2_9BACI|nr:MULTISPECIES: hypothetical protein [Bacillus]PEB48784.1 hypothetical protein COO03_23970 [Bacillus sp. AFS098217]PED79966.1 hypothetical protein CON65_25480 [Bacillus pseudomycoides]PEU05452.1 hypothetical protein CN524_25445 [Bacillus sp. AFS019443]PEU18052.1 hypothetical protein CN525_13225 [Bacillus sp. AFS014408]PFW62196.1 hypothetical protein COL20_13965 [Bacillus sp. AFS075034]
MWKTIVSYLPGWKVVVPAFIVFFIPYVFSKIFGWIRALEEE